MPKIIQTNIDCIAEELRLPDGRTFVTRDLMAMAKKNYKSHKIKNTARFYALTPAAESREEKHQRIVKMKIHQVATEYATTETQAWFKIKFSHKALGLPSPKKADFK